MLGPMRVGIFAAPADPVARHVAKHLEGRGAEVLHYAFERLATGEPIAYDGEEWLTRGPALSDCDAAFVRSFPGPTAPLGEDPNQMISAAEAWRRALAQCERSHVAESCLIDLELAGRRVLNPVAATRAYNLKPVQIAALRRAGVPMPATLITNSANAVHAFRRQYPELIYKPVAGGAEARALDAEAVSNLGALAAAPVIFQERVHGPDIRVTVVDGELISAVEIPTDEIDYRRSARYREGLQDYVPIELPPEVGALCLEVASRCQQILSGVDLKRRPDGQYVVIEANASPVYLDIEQKSGHPITEAIGRYLLGE